MAAKRNPLRSILSALPRARPPLVGLEVEDSTWDEWTAVVNDADARAPDITARDEARPGDKPGRAGAGGKPGAR